MSRYLAAVILFLSILPIPVFAEKQNDRIDETVEALDQPLYSPFVERYVLDELKQLRVDQAKPNTSSSSKSLIESTCPWIEQLLMPPIR